MLMYLNPVVRYGSLVHWCSMVRYFVSVASGLQCSHPRAMCLLFLTRFVGELAQTFSRQSQNPNVEVLAHAKVGHLRKRIARTRPFQLASPDQFSGHVHRGHLRLLAGAVSHCQKS